MSTLADRQAEFCSWLIAGSSPLSLVGLPMRSGAAIGGNGTQENLCQPVTLGAKDHGSDGVLQWREERLAGPDGLQPWCASKGLAWDTLKSQAFFTLHELTQPKYAALLADLEAGTKTLETLTLDFCDAFERPSEAGRAPDKRIQYAHDCLTILMRNSTQPGPIHPPVVVAAPSVPSTESLQMPIELILQLVAPLAESLVAGLLNGVLTHVQTTGLPASPLHPAIPPMAPSAIGGLTEADFARLAQLIAGQLAALNAPKPAA